MHIGPKVGDPSNEIPHTPVNLSNLACTVLSCSAAHVAALWWKHLDS